jgi:signal transduction histidine kinase
VELAIREALANAVVHGNRKDGETKVHIRCRCGPGKEISIVVADQGKGFDFRNIEDNGVKSDAAGEHGHGIRLMKAYMHMWTMCTLNAVGRKFLCASVLETVGTRANSRITPRVSDRGETTLTFEGSSALYE